MVSKKNNKNNAEVAKNFTLLMYERKKNTSSRARLLYSTHINNTVIQSEIHIYTISIVVLMFFSAPTEVMAVRQQCIYSEHCNRQP